MKVIKAAAYQGSSAMAIWDGDSDDLPFSDPLNNLSRLKFHSALHYPKVIATRTVAVALASLGSNADQKITHTLFAHGQSGVPWIRGRAVIGSAVVNLAGHVPVQTSANTIWFGRPNGVFCRFVALGCDSTNVYLHEYAKCAQNNAIAALNLSVTVYIMDEILE